MVQKSSEIIYLDYYFLEVIFTKIPLFSKALITVIISFVSLFVIAIPEPLIDANL